MGIDIWSMCGFVTVLVLLTVVSVCAARDVAAFKEEYPPISDEEFLKRCSSSVRPEVALKVRQLVAAPSGVEYERLHPDTKFIDLYA